MKFRRIFLFTFSFGAWLCLIIMSWCAILVSPIFDMNYYGEMYFEFFLINLMFIIFSICLILELKVKKNERIK